MSDSEAEDSGHSENEASSASLVLRVRRTNFAWTDETIYFFVKACRNHKVHLKEAGGMSKLTRWQFVLSELKAQPTFASLTCDIKNLQKKLKTEKDRCRRKYGISDQTTNLSGINRCPTQIDKVLLSLITKGNQKM